MTDIEKKMEEFRGLGKVCEGVPMWEEKDLVLSGDGKCWRLWDWNSQSLEIDNDDVISDDAEALKRFVGKARTWMPILLRMVEYLSSKRHYGGPEAIKSALAEAIDD